MGGHFVRLCGDMNDGEHDRESTGRRDATAAERWSGGGGTGIDGGRGATARERGTAARDAGPVRPEKDEEG